MGLFTSLTGNGMPTKYEVAGRVAALIKTVVDDIGVKGLIAGMIVLTKDFEVAYRGSGPNCCAKVSPKRHLIKWFSESELLSARGLNSIAIDRLTAAVIADFEDQSSGFANLGTLFKPRGNYAVDAKSSQFINAMNTRNQTEIEKLLTHNSEIHYSAEIYDNIGQAKARERQISHLFAKVSSYERMLY